MQTSFEQHEEKVAEEAASQEIVERPNNAPVTKNHWAGEGVEGEIDMGDIQLPRLNLVGHSGKLKTKFTPGTFLFAKEVILSDGKTPLEITFLHIKKQFQEALPFNPDGPTPKLFNTSEEVRAAGGHFDWETKEGLYRDIAHLWCLIECPPTATAEQRELFFLDFNGRAFAQAMYTVNGGAYTSVAKPVITAAASHLKTGLYKGKWKLTSEEREDARNTWMSPILKTAGKHTPEFQEFAASLLG